MKPTPCPMRIPDMAEASGSSGYLGAGQFYGKVSQKRVLPSAILSEVVHRGRVIVPHHSHELAYFTLVVGGSYAEQFGRRNEVHQPMSVLWHRPGISHRDSIGSRGGRFFTVEIDARAIDSLGEYTRVPEDFVEYGTPTVWLAMRLFHEFANWRDDSSRIADDLTLEMLGSSADGRSQSSDGEPPWLNRVIDRLHDEYVKNVSTGELARTANVHPVHLAAVFRRFKRQTIAEYVQQLRVSRASQLFTKRDMALADIACECGFADQSHFTRMFKRYTGMTPGAFKRSLA